MRRRGLATVTALVAVVVVGCSSQGEVAGELRDIREVVAEDEGSAGEEVGLEEEGGGEETLGEGGSGASAEAPDGSSGMEDPDLDVEVDITVVPEEITLEYVQAVLDELERIYAEAVVLMMQEGELTLEVTDRVGEIFALRQRDIRLEEFVDTADVGFPGMRPPADIELRRRIAEEILDQGDGCIYVHTVTDDSPYFVDPVDPLDVYVLLEAPTVERPVDINPTRWVYGAFGVGERLEMEEVAPCSE